MSNLEELTMLGSNNSTYFDTLKAFCKKFGGKLTFLHYGGKNPERDANEDNLVPDHLLDHCPLLNHLVVSPGFLPDTMHHPGIKYCDLWSHVFAKKRSTSVGIPELPLDKVRRAFPDLEGIRVLDIELFSALDLPLSIWPDDETDFELQFPGIHIRKSDIFLLSCDLPALNREIAKNADGMDDDTQYSPDDVPDDSSDGSSSLDAGSDMELGTSEAFEKL